VYVSILGQNCDLGPEAGRYDSKLLEQISVDELSANAPLNETKPDKDARHLRNHRCNTGRRNTIARAQRALGPPIGPRNPQNNFDEVGCPAFNHPMINLAVAALLMQNLPDTPEFRRMQFLTKEALYQMDR